MGESQSMVDSLSGLRTMYVSLGLRPVDSGGVQVARAPHRSVIASRCRRAWSIRVRRSGCRMVPGLRSSTSSSMLLWSMAPTSL